MNGGCSGIKENEKKKIFHLKHDKNQIGQLLSYAGFHTIEYNPVRKSFNSGDLEIGGADLWMRLPAFLSGTGPGVCCRFKTNIPLPISRAENARCCFQIHAEILHDEFENFAALWIEGLMVAIRPVIQPRHFSQHGPMSTVRAWLDRDPAPGGKSQFSCPHPASFFVHLSDPPSS